MSLRIGLDFDNTIANYDEAFPRVAQILGYKTVAKNKRDLKTELIASSAGEKAWQEVQGLTYGKHIDQASLFPGVLEFMVRARARKCEIFVVSHKTELGHFDETKTSLRDAATAWMSSKRFLGDGVDLLDKSQIFYAATREEKIKRICELNLDVFVDDLSEVLNDAGFPEKTRRILYGLDGVNSNSSEPTFYCSPSWREIADEIFGPVSSADIKFGIRHFWPDLECSDVEQVEGRGNSKIFRIETNAERLALKVYPDLSVDSRTRRETEWSALSFLHTKGMPIPVPVATDIDLNWSLLQWLNGNLGNPQDGSQIDAAANFVRHVHEISKTVDRSSAFKFATESCLTPELVEQQIRGRLNSLKPIHDEELQDFLISQLEPKFIENLTIAKEMLGEKYSDKLADEFWTLSPSDFGLHNAIVSITDEVFFFDFEYFGWDDPVKLTSDFCLHPGMSLSFENRKKWMTKMKQIFGSEKNFDSRLIALYPLYAVRWALIMLNEFRSDKVKNRLHAQSRVETDLRNVQLAQLQKAKLMIQNSDRSIFDAI